MRVLVLAHGHPDLSPGGGERAAYSLFQRLKQSPDVTKAVFAASTDPRTIGHDASFGSFRGRPDEILVATPPVDGFTFQTLGYDVLERLVNDLMQAVKPDVVHVHHFINWGLEVFGLFRQAGVRIVFTFHEFGAVCARFGQMVKADGRLCHAASPGECSLCLPSLSAGKLFVRATILKSLFGHVDHFIAPSHFLKDRHVAWGLSPDRITVIENLLDATVVERARALPDEYADRARGAKLVFGFFAQINPFKGFDVLLEAALLLPDDVRSKVAIRVYGENRHYRDTEFHQRTEILLDEAQDVVYPMGAYRGEDVFDLMSACDWIVVPSIWWENSPVVIQEARLAARPLIVSNIGGMAEKVDASIDHLFPAGSPGALANLISTLVRAKARPDSKRLKHLAQTRVEADGIHFARHCAVYNEVLTQPAAALSVA